MSEFSPGRLLSILTRLPVPRRYLLAYSGGVDSHVLLQALALLRPQLSAPLVVVHVNHGIHAESVRWAEHCRLVCERLGLEFDMHAVNARPQPGESPEAAARLARYTVFTGLIGPGDMLLTAHHQDDQAETLLLQLLRGAGPKGLAAMPELKAFAAGHHARPLLGFSRESLTAYARQQGYSWIDDPSNDEVAYKRNFLRHEILPRLRGQWPAVARTLSRSAGHCAEASELLDELGDSDLDALQLEDSISLPGLLALSAPRQRNLLRRWCVRRQLALPTEAQLQQIQQQIVAAPDHLPLISWPGAELRRYQGRLYLQPPLPPLPPDCSLTWDLDQVLKLPQGTLTAVIGCQTGLSVRIRQQPIRVKFRVGGERLLMPSGHHHPLKKLLQEYRVLPWWRDRVPLIYVGDELAAVADLVIDDRFRAQQGEAAIRFEWQRYSQGGNSSE